MAIARWLLSTPRVIALQWLERPAAVVDCHESLWKRLLGVGLYFTEPSAATTRASSCSEGALYNGGRPQDSSGGGSPCLTTWCPLSAVPAGAAANAGLSVPPPGATGEGRYSRAEARATLFRPIEKVPK